MQDKTIIAAAVADRAAYRIALEHADPSDFTPTGEFWWKLVKDWYQADPDATSVDFEILLDRGRRQAGRNAELALEWAGTMPPVPSTANVAREILELKRLKVWDKLALAQESGEEHDIILELTQEHYDLMMATDLADKGLEFDTSHGFEEETEGTIVPVAPFTFSKRLGGGAPPGSHIVVFGRVESGKTLFSVNLVAHWLRNEKRVLYIGNEEPMYRVRQRLRCNLSGMTKDQYMKHRTEADRRCEVGGIENFYCTHMMPGTPGEIEQFVRASKPDCIVIDQLRNVSAGGRHGTRAQSLDKAASSVRQIVSSYGLVGLSVGQANAGEHGKERLYLSADDFDESRTGVPGSADVMVGIGTSEAYNATNRRAVTLPKNKLTGDHQSFEIKVDTQRSSIA